jgi:hypothetical protein
MNQHFKNAQEYFKSEKVDMDWVVGACIIYGFAIVLPEVFAIGSFEKDGETCSPDEADTAFIIYASGDLKLIAGKCFSHLDKVKFQRGAKGDLRTRVYSSKRFQRILNAL